MVREGFVVCLRVLNNYTPPSTGFNEVNTRIVDLHFWDVEDPLNFGSVTEAATKDAAIIGEEMKIKKMKGDLHQFGTRVARAIWPEKRSVQRMGVLVLSLCALLAFHEPEKFRNCSWAQPKARPKPRPNFPPRHRRRS